MHIYVPLSSISLEFLIISFHSCIKELLLFREIKYQKLNGLMKDIITYEAGNSITKCKTSRITLFSGIKWKVVKCIKWVMKSTRQKAHSVKTWTAALERQTYDVACVLGKKKNCNPKLLTLCLRITERSTSVIQDNKEIQHGPHVKVSESTITL